MTISSVSVRPPSSFSRSQGSDPLPRLPTIFLSDLVYFVLHLFLGQPHVLLLPGVVVRLSAWPQKVSDNQLRAKAEVLSPDGSYVSLLQILENDYKIIFEDKE